MATSFSASESNRYTCSPQSDARRSRGQEDRRHPSHGPGLGLTPLYRKRPANLGLQENPQFGAMLTSGEQNDAT